MKLSELLSPWVQRLSIDFEVLSLSNDSRHIQSGALFLAYPGAATDGRTYIQQAISAGAAAVVFDPLGLDVAFTMPAAFPGIPIPQLASQLAAIASRFYHYPSKALTFTAVTGTNGKTTIAYQLAQAHDLLGQRAAYVGTLGQGEVQTLLPLSNTTPDALCLQRLFYTYQQQGIHQVCMEVSSHALSQQRVAQIEFEQAIFTNLTLDHLDYHVTMDAYASAKASLFATPSLKWAIVNQDDAYSTTMLSARVEPCEVLTYGLHSACDVRALNCHISMTGSEFDVESPWGRHHIRVKVLGLFNIYNSLAVLTSLCAQGYPPQAVVDIMPQLHASPGRMEVVAECPCVIVDYAHTPDALQNVLTTLTELKQARIWVIFGCGGDRDKTKRPLMGQIASQYADVVMITSDNPRSEDPVQIMNEIYAGVVSHTEVLQNSDRKAAIHHVLSLAKAQDIVLIAGKGHEAYQQIGTERLAFSDQSVVRDYFLRESV